MTPDGKRLLSDVAPSLPSAFREAIDALPEAFVAAASEKRPVYVSDIATDPLWNSYRAPALSHGLRACLSTPIFSAAGDLLGTFALYYLEARRPAEGDLERVESATRMAAIAIERSRAEEARDRALREARYERTRLHDLFMRAPAVVCVFRGPDHVFELANPLYLRLVGGKRESETLGRPVRKVLPELVGQGYFELLDRVYATGEPFSGDEMSVRLDRRGDGRLEERFVNVVYEPTRDPYGKVDGVMCHAVDVTTQVRARRELEDMAGNLERQRRLYETIISNTPDLAYVFDLQHRFVYANQALLRMWGRTLEDSIGKDCLQVGYEPWHAEMHDREIDQVVATKQPIRGVVPFNGTEGRRMYDYIFVPVIGEDGNVEAVAGTTRDITEFIEAEQKLERRVQERTAELEHANRESEGFNYSISHDLRAPLRSIAATSNILLEELGPQIDEEYRTLLDRQSQNASRLGRLIDELLRLSRLSRAEVDRQALDMTKEARVVAESEHETYPSGRVEIQEGMRGTGDSALVQMLLHNLIGNALKFSSEGGIVRVSQTGDVFSVSDEGVGFDMEYAHRIFLPFERLVTESEFPGTGIGLANVERIVKRHGGRVWAESAPGQGAKFSFTLGE